MNNKTFNDACEAGDIDTVNELIDIIDINYQNQLGFSNLMQAVKSAKKSEPDAAMTLDVLKERNARIDLKTIDGSTALIIAVKQGNHMAILNILEYEQDINIQPNDGMNALMHASRIGDTNTVNLLIELGASLDMQSTSGITAVMWASWNKHDETVDALIKQGADINIKDVNGNTLLMSACENKNEYVACLLYEMGVDFFAENAKGVSAHSIIIRKQGLPEKMRALQEMFLLRQDIEDDQPMGM